MSGPGGADDGDAGALFVDESGPEDGPVVVLVHGTMDRSTGFAKVARRLDDRYRVVRYDRRGYARSRAVPGPYGCATHVNDLVSVMAGRPAVVVGHSYGGNVALAAAAQRPDIVRSVVFYETPLPWQPWWPGTTAGVAAVAAGREGGPEEAAEQFLRRLLGDEVWERLPERTKVARRAEGHALVGEMVDVQTLAPWEPWEVTVPVVGGHGTRSRDHHPPAVRWIVERVDGAELMVVDGAGHGAHLSHPDAFASLVERAVERADARR